LISDFNFGEKRGLVEFLNRVRLLVLARLLQIDAVARTIERHLALLAATLRADAPVHRRAKALLFALLANGTAQS
jgi:hypothetical protein